MVSVPLTDVTHRPTRGREAPPASRRADAGEPEGSPFFRGILVALPLGLWSALVWAALRLL